MDKARFNHIKTVPDALNFMVQEYGTEILNNPTRCKYFFDDLVPASRSEQVDLFMVALSNEHLSAFTQKHGNSQKRINKLYNDLIKEAHLNGKSATEICKMVAEGLKLKVEIPEEKEIVEKRKKTHSLLLRAGLVIVAIAVVVIGIKWFKNFINTAKIKKDYIGVSYNEAVDELKKAGFKDVTAKPLKDINIIPSDDTDKVDQILVNGKSDYDKDAAISKNSRIEVLYHSISESYSIRVQFDANTSQGESYKSVIEKMKKVGFTNVGVEELPVLKLNEKERVDTVHNIAINGDLHYQKGDVFPVDSKVEVRYLAYSNSVKATIPLSLLEATGQAYEHVKEAFEEAGFVNVFVKPTYDITNENGFSINTVSKVTIDGKESFEKGKSIIKTSEIVVLYHQYSNDYKIETPESSKEFKGMDYKKAIEKLTDAGFDPERIELDTVKEGIFDFFVEDEVKTISINGTDDFDKGDKFPINSKIKITYYIDD